MAETHKPLVFCGPSGVGKSTFYTRLQENYPGKFALSVSCTTRDPRPGEQEGVNYYYKSNEEVEKLIAEDAFVECHKVHANTYGTLHSELARIRDNGQIWILDVDIQGVKAIQAHGMDCVFVGLGPPDLDTLEQRLRGRRTETEENIQIRLANATKEMQAMESVDLWTVYLINEEISSCWQGLIEQLTPLYPSVLG